MYERWISLLFCGSLLLAAVLFWPALGGPLILDDNIHLPKLGQYNGAIDTPVEVLKLTFSGGSAVGRPLSFLSLLINDNAWPSGPWGFKYTNLLFHLLNGVLVFALCRKLASIFETRSLTGAGHNSNKIALLAMLIWLIHPIHISTTMMVIQRMTLLSALFTLLGLLTYLSGRSLVLERPKKGYLIMTLAVVGIGGLGITAKETAISMMCYLVIIELVMLRTLSIPSPKHWRLWFGVFVLGPLLMVVAYFFVDLEHMKELYLKRDFTMGERLMTQARVMVDYLQVIVFPGQSNTGPYHDDYLVSRGLFNPISTGLSILLIAVLILAAIRWRRKYVWYSVAVLWFFAGHLLESTVLPIELYFEHRNYLPMLGIVLAVSYSVFSVSQKIKKFVFVAAAIFVVMESGVTYASSLIWGDESRLANVWAYEHPRSQRAQVDAVYYWLKHGDVQKVKQHFKVARGYHPDDAGIALYSFIVDRCSAMKDVIDAATYDELLRTILSARFEHASLDGVSFIKRNRKSGRCRVTWDENMAIVNGYLDNPRFSGVDMSRYSLLAVKADLYREKGALDETIKTLDAAYEAIPSYEVPLMQSYYLTTAGLYDDALAYVEKARLTPPRKMVERLYMYDEIDEYEQAIEMQMRTARTKG